VLALLPFLTPTGDFSLPQLRESHLGIATGHTAGPLERTAQLSAHRATPEHMESRVFHIRIPRTHLRLRRVCSILIAAREIRVRDILLAYSEATS
jgi:hypothetical protein